MDQASLADVQRRRCYPSITLLFTTTPGPHLGAADIESAERLVQQADDRLVGDVDDDTRRQLVDRLRETIRTHAGQRSTHALAVFVSPEIASTVRLGHAVDDRVTIDDTFTTRDLVADAKRTVVYRVLAVSERMVRVFDGDRERLIERRDDDWPLLRADEDTPSTWARAVDAGLRRLDAQPVVPTVVAGVESSVRRLARHVQRSIGSVAGGHDRTTAAALHLSTWPVVAAWLEAETARAAALLDRARSANLFAGGIHEVWPLALEGRIATLVVEEDFVFPARTDANNQLHPAEDTHHPDVNDDVVDDAIEAVLLREGDVVLVRAGSLRQSQHIAAALRY